MAKTKVNTKLVKKLVNVMKNSPKMKNLKSTTSTVAFKRTTVAPNIEQLAPKVYRARVTVNGIRESFQTTAITKAKNWIKRVKATGKSTLS